MCPRCFGRAIARDTGHPPLHVRIARRGESVRFEKVGVRTLRRLRQNLETVWETVHIGMSLLFEAESLRQTGQNDAADRRFAPEVLSRSPIPRQQAPATVGSIGHERMVCAGSCAPARQALFSADRSCETSFLRLRVQHHPSPTPESVSLLHPQEPRPWYTRHQIEDHLPFTSLLCRLDVEPQASFHADGALDADLLNLQAILAGLRRLVGFGARMIRAHGVDMRTAQDRILHPAAFILAERQESISRDLHQSTAPSDGARRVWLRQP
mmetsp:Transcript_29412/g.77755  ORF Transcript_29412/g.77755 Transcript_29412/m.77755 type:complete len:268 (+) Transcript_29412:882-1685(+)